MICKIKLEPGALMPVKNNETDNCYDIFSNNYYNINPGVTTKINTGIRVCPESGWGIVVRPRSGRSLNGLILGGGEIDNGYRGEIGVIIHNFSNSIITVNKHEKIAQIRPIRIEDIDFVQVQELPESKRGKKGFGSSGNFLEEVR